MAQKRFLNKRQLLCNVLDIDFSQQNAAIRSWSELSFPSTSRWRSRHCRTICSENLKAPLETKVPWKLKVLAIRCLRLVEGHSFGLCLGIEFRLCAQTVSGFSLSKHFRALRDTEV